jgi:peptidoglycan/LPS O-acetylase OafA/YrhL
MIEWIPIVGIIASSAMVIWVVSLVTAARTRRVEAQVQMQAKLIERFGSAPELVEFLHSPAGRQFVAGVQSAPAALSRERIMSGFTRAIIMTALGVAFCFIAFYDDDGDWFIPASIVFSLGIGYLIATAVSWRFSKSLAERDAFPQNNA